MPDPRPLSEREGEKLPDNMGVWAEDGEQVWLPLAHYPKRIDAIRWAMDEWGCALPDVRCRKRWMVYSPEPVLNLNGAVAYVEDYWRECEAETSGAFPVWRLEGA